MDGEKPPSKDDGISALELGSNLEDPLSDFDSDAPGEDGYTDDDSDTIALDKVRLAVRQYGKDGITVSEIVEATNLSRKTVDKHLDTLRRLREVYRKKRNKQMYLYYPNGKPLHAYGRKRVEDGENILDIQLAQGRNDELFIHMTEKRYSLMEGETTEGAVIFPLSTLDDVFQKLQEFANEVEE